MDFESFKPLLHKSWWSKLQPFIESEECDRIYKFLKKDAKRGRILCPSSSNVWRCFLETPYDDVRVIMCGLSPYHSLIYGKPIADGLLMSCSITDKLQPSLEQWYSALKKDIYHGLDIEIEKSPSLVYLAKQGVLMLNASLTTEANKAGSHLALWEPFMKYLFEDVLVTTGIPVIFLGKEAAKLEKYVMPFTWIFKLSHPASAAYTQTEWSSEGTFTKVSKILKGNNNQKIQWLNTEI